MRTAFMGLLILHGLIHLLGFAKAFGFAQLPQLSQSISRPLGGLWLVAGLVMIASAFMPARWLWPAGALAVVLSTVVIISSWHDAKFGMIANVVVLLGVGYAFAAEGPFSLAAEYRRDRASILTDPGRPSIVSEADLAPLPASVQRYLRVTGTVGQPHIVSLRARWKGRMRGAASEPWMSFEAEQVNTFGGMPARLFSMDATKKGLPVAVYHRFISDGCGSSAAGRNRASSIT